MNVTISDIAKDCGVSSATVSKYLNGKKVSKENSEKIAASIRRLNYIPNRNARLLRSKRGSSIAVILTHMNDYFWGNAVNGFEACASAHGYPLILERFDPLIKDQTSFVNSLTASSTAGCLLIDENVADTNLLNILEQRKIPYVFSDSNPSGHTFDLVTTANFEGAFYAASYLLEKGHRRIAVLSGPENRYTSSERIRGVYAAYRNDSLSAENLQIYYGDYDFASGIDMFRKVLKSSPRPTAVLSMNYYYMAAGIQMIRSSGLNVPEDISLISFDDDDIFSAYDPPITCYQQNMQKIGQEAAELLIRRIEGDMTGFPQKIFERPLFIERSSVLDLNEQAP